MWKIIVDVCSNNAAAPENDKVSLFCVSFFLQGQLKEKKGKWKVFKRWKTRYFTLSGGTFTYSKSNSVSTYLKMIIIQTLTGAIRDFVYNLLPVP